MALGLVVVEEASALSTTHGSVRVCTNTACEKAGSTDVLEGLHILASVSEEANQAASKAASTKSVASLAAMQAAFAAARVDSCGCLGGCGSGPNCVAATEDEEVFYDVYKPASQSALLEAAGLHVPDAATKGWLRRMYAVRALRSNKPTEARARLTEALQEAGTLRGDGANLLSHLLELRADVAESVGDVSEADEDRARAIQMSVGRRSKLATFAFCHAR